MPPSSTTPAEKLSAPFAFEPEGDAEPNTFAGYVSVFGSPVDAYVPTIVDRGAFSKTIQEHSSRVKILWQHDSYEPIGVPLELREDERGLFVRGRIRETQRGKDALILMRDRVVTEFSVGFDPIQDTKDEDGVRHLKEMRLWEASPVTWGADAETHLTEIHSRAAGMTPLAAAIERWRRALAASPDSEEYTAAVIELAQAREVLEDMMSGMTACDPAEPAPEPLTDVASLIDAKHQLRILLADEAIR